MKKPETAEELDRIAGLLVCVSAHEIARAFGIKLPPDEEFESKIRKRISDTKFQSDLRETFRMIPQGSETMARMLQFYLDSVGPSKYMSAYDILPPTAWNEELERILLDKILEDNDPHPEDLLSILEVTLNGTTELRATNAFLSKPKRYDDVFRLFCTVRGNESRALATEALIAEQRTEEELRKLLEITLTRDDSNGQLFDLRARIIPALVEKMTGEVPASA